MAAIRWQDSKVYGANMSESYIQYPSETLVKELIFLCRAFPDSKVHGTNMGPSWVLSAPDGPHVGSMTLAIRVAPRCLVGVYLQSMGPKTSPTAACWEYVPYLTIISTFRWGYTRFLHTSLAHIWTTGIYVKRFFNFCYCELVYHGNHLQ